MPNITWGKQTERSKPGYTQLPHFPAGAADFRWCTGYPASLPGVRNGAPAGAQGQLVGCAA